jgi:hypothetical protein
MTPNALSYALSDPAIAVPGQAEVIKELTKLVIIHKLNMGMWL